MEGGLLQGQLGTPRIKKKPSHFKTGRDIMSLKATEVLNKIQPCKTKDIWQTQNFPSFGDGDKPGCVYSKSQQMYRKSTNYRTVQAIFLRI